MSPHGKTLPHKYSTMNESKPDRAPTTSDLSFFKRMVFDRLLSHITVLWKEAVIRRIKQSRINLRIFFIIQYLKMRLHRMKVPIGGNTGLFIDIIINKIGLGPSTSETISIPRDRFSERQRAIQPILTKNPYWELDRLADLCGWRKVITYIAQLQIPQDIASVIGCDLNQIRTRGCVIIC